MQKIFYLIIVFITVSLVSNAQIKKGSILLGGNIQFGTQSTSASAINGASNNSYLYLTPSVGKAIKENLVVGIGLNYYGSTQKQQSLPTSGKSHSYGAGFFLRRYKSLGSRLYIFTQGGLNGAYYNSSTQNVDPAQNTQGLKGYYISLAFYPGIAYAITDCVQLETGFQNLLYAQYSHQKETDNYPGATPNTATSNTNGFAFGTGLNNSLYGFVVGFRVLMGH